MATFVLVHGGCVGGWSWKRVSPFLRAAGHDVYAPTLTGLGERVHLASPEVGLETHIQDIVNVLEYEDLHDVILVGHSYGGQVITGVADRAPQRLAHLVYLDACAPQPGQSCLDQWPDDRAAMDEQVQKDGDGWRLLPMFAAWQEAGVTEDRDLQWLVTLQSPQPYKTFQDAIVFDPGTVESTPRIYIECIGDRPRPVEPPPFTAGMRYWTLARGHAAPITAPQEVATLLLHVVEMTTPRTDTL